MSLFLSRELTRSKPDTVGVPSRFVEHRFVPLSEQEAQHRSERFRGLLTRGALILASRSTGGVS